MGNAYEQAGEALLRESGCTVRKWRTKNTGRAYTRAADWGIEAPRPRGPVSFATFAHEVAHQMLHRSNGSYPRWLEEVEAWEWALEQFDRFSLNGVDRARLDAARHLSWTATKRLRNSSTSSETIVVLLRRYSWVWDVVDQPDQSAL